MADVNYINTQEIRRDLVGFLCRLADGKEYMVLNRSKPLVRVRGTAASGTAEKNPRQNTQEFLAIAAKARAQAKGTLDPNKSYKELYAETMAEKHGIPRR
jgi:antitoxin (DNA-binding transcriptional repressor) of toxin-antitoxin stability system